MSINFAGRLSLASAAGRGRLDGLLSPPCRPDQVSHMTDDEVAKALQVIASRPDVSEHELIVSFMARGFTEVSACKMATLIPFAFGRVLLSHMGITDVSRTFLLQTDDGSVHERDFGEEPIFCSALVLAIRMFHEGPRHLFRAAAERSAEVRAASNALASGQPLVGARLHPPRIFAESLAEWSRQ